ncbi:MAG TPA: hypothetical protein VGJ91_05210 [Polyangiaceae bacterium]|jgi:hypothetical protein
MFKQSLLLGGLSWLVLVCIPSCGSDKKCEGGETCACYANGTCNAGLECRSNLCVSLNGSSGGSTGSSFDTKACLSCAQSSCANEASACKASSGCETLISCMLGCSSDATCLANCAKGVTPDNITKEGTYQVCALTKCTSDCTYTPSIPSGSGGSGNGSAGQSSSAGGSSKAGSGSTSGGNGNTGAAGGGSSDPVSGVNWLGLVEDAAPSDYGVNGKLGIEGVFYAYADPCSTDGMSWDPTTRCISGTMCAQDSQGVNWGVAIGFDFNNVDSVKHAWSATTAGVTGIAWSTTGTSASSGTMQIWVQNMDPSFNGSCSSMNCNINAPPDGNSSPLASGQFTFASMVKDVWGPGADSYVFNPANISALQFKLRTGPSTSSYSLCVVGVGVLR